MSIVYNLNMHYRSWRARQNAWSRRLTSEARLDVSDFIMPIIVAPGTNVVRPIMSIPGVNAYSLDNIWPILDSVMDYGIPSVMLIPACDVMDAEEDEATILQDYILPKIADKKLPLGIMVDVNYLQVNHLAQDGLLKDGRMVYERTIAALVQQAVCIAEAGANTICLPGHLANCVSDARKSLNENELSEVMLVSHAANYASSLNVQPHTWKNDSWVGGLDESDYLMDVSNAKEALREAKLDMMDGVDWLMVQPASLSQDIIFRVSQMSSLPVIAYHLSGEYLQNWLYAEARHLNPTRVMYESLLAIKRSGATAICTHAALDVVKDLEALSLV